MTQLPFSAALEFERNVKEMNGWNIPCSGDDDCMICKEMARLLDVFIKSLRSDNGHG